MTVLSLLEILFFSPPFHPPAPPKHHKKQPKTTRRLVPPARPAKQHAERPACSLTSEANQTSQVNKSMRREDANPGSHGHGRSRGGGEGHGDRGARAL